MNPTTCPKCGAALDAASAAGTSCPACQQPLAPAVAAKPRGKSYLFWSLLLLVFPLLVAMIFRTEEAIVASTFLLAPVCGLAAGICLGLNLGRSGGAKLILALGLSVACVFCTETLMAIGCGSGLLNLKMNFH